MFKNFLIFLVFFFSPLCINGSSIRLDSNDFCNAENLCSHRNAPHVVQCGPSMCTKNEATCKVFGSVVEMIKYNGLIPFLDVMISRKNYIHLQENFKSFQSKIKKCSQTRYDWRTANDVCMRGRNCFKKKFINEMLDAFFRSKNVICSCPKSKPFVCGNQRDYCSLNREACNSLIYFKNRNLNNFYHSIDKCENDFNFT